MSIVTALNCPTCEGEGVAGGEICTTCGGSGEVEDASATGLQDEIPQPTSDNPLGLRIGVDVPQYIDAPARDLAAAPDEDPMSQALTEVTQHGTKIMELVAHARTLAERFRNVVFDVRTTKGMDEAKKARQALREEARYPMQKLRDARSKTLGTMQRQANTSADALIAEVEGYELPIHEQIEAEEARKEAVRKEQAEAEQRRVDGHLSAIRALTTMATDAAGMDSAGIRQQTAALEAAIIDEGYEEFQGQARQARDEALRQLNGLLVAALAEEAELEETRRQQAALREAQERLAADQRAQAEQAAAMAAEREALDREKAELAEQRAQQERAQQERRDAVQRRVEELRFVATGGTLAPATASELQALIESLRALQITAELFDDRAEEADRHRQVAIGNLNEQLSAAVERELEEARQQRAAQVQELIDNIRAMGDSAALAVEDGSADMRELQAGLDELRNTFCTPDLFGERAAEAMEARTNAVLLIEDAIAATMERGRLRAEEAERQRQQHEADAVMRQRQLRLTAAAPRLFALLVRMLPELESSDDSVCLSYAPEVRDLVREIQGEDHA